MNKTFEKEFEASTEYVLSDYMGDVKKMLSTKATVIPTSRFVNNGEAQFVGTVEFDILYSDVDGKLTAVQTSADYDFTVPTSENAADAFIESRIANFSVRLTGPRKLVAKASVASDIYVSESDEIICLGDVFEESREPETVTKTVKLENAIYAVSAEREYAEEAAVLESISSDMLDVIITSGSVRILETRAEEGGVNVKGEIIITSIVRNEEQPPFAIKKVIPFEELVTVEGVGAGMESVARGYLTSAVTAFSESEENCSVNVNAIMELSVIAARNDEVKVTADAYLEEYETKGEYEDFSYSELLSSHNVTESVTFEIPRNGTGYENIRDIISGNFDVRGITRNQKDNGFEVSGEILISGVACEINDDNSESYIQLKYTTPFAINVNTQGALPTGARIECRAMPIDVDFTIEPDNVIAKCSLAVYYRIYKDSFVRRISTCNIVGEAENARTKSVIRVYYPEPRDTLFDIARRYHTTSAKIAADNDLSEECLASVDKEVSLSGVKKLIIR